VRVQYSKRNMSVVQELPPAACLRHYRRRQRYVHSYLFATSATRCHYFAVLRRYVALPRTKSRALIRPVAPRQREALREENITRGRISESVRGECLVFVDVAEALIALERGMSELRQDMAVAEVAFYVDAQGRRRQR